MKPRIIIANNFWHLDQAGGSYKISTDLAIHLSGRGYDIHYICMNEKKRSMDISVEQGVKIWRYPMSETSGKRKSLLNFFYHLKQAGEIAQRIHKELPRDGRVVLNGHGGLQYLGALNKLPRRIISKKVMSVHSPMEAEYSSEKMGDPWTVMDFFASRLLSNTESRCYANSDVIQCDSEFTQSLLNKKFSRAVSGRTVVCPGYVDTKKFSLLDKPKRLVRSEIGYPDWQTDHTVFFCLRRHVRRMGIDNLVRAAAWLREKMAGQREFRVVIGGDGPLRGEFEKLTAELKLEKHVFFLGKIPEQDLAAHYQAADCFVLPTRALECFGLIILEAFACGTPVIATPVGSIPEVLGDFGHESLTAGSEPEDIGRSMLEFLDHPRRNHEQLRRYAESFDKKKILDRLEKIVVGDPETTL